MSVFQTGQQSVAADSSTRASDGAVIGLFPPHEFERARSRIADLDQYPSYLDWLDCCEGLQMGLSLAGVDAAVTHVSLDGFLLWCELQNRPPHLNALNAFAEIASVAARTRPLAALAEFDQRGFDDVRPLVAAFSRFLDLAEWSMHRSARRAEIAASGVLVVDQPIRIEQLIEWCGCVGEETSEAALDVYAGLLLELLTECDEPPESPARPSRPPHIVNHV